MNVMPSSRFPTHRDAPQQPSSAHLRVVRGDWFRELRSDAGLTQSQVADELGTTIQAISNVENGGYALGSDRFPSLAELYGVDRINFGRKWLAVSNPVLFLMLFPGEQENIAGTLLPVLARNNARNT